MRVNKTAAQFAYQLATMNPYGTGAPKCFLMTFGRRIPGCRTQVQRPDRKLDIVPGNARPRYKSVLLFRLSPGPPTFFHNHTGLRLPLILSATVQTGSAVNCRTSWLDSGSKVGIGIIAFDLWSRTGASKNLKPRGCHTYNPRHSKILPSLVHLVHGTRPAPFN